MAYFEQRKRLHFLEPGMKVMRRAKNNIGKAILTAGIVGIVAVIAGKKSRRSER